MRGDPLLSAFLRSSVFARTFLDFGLMDPSDTLVIVELDDNHETDARTFFVALKRRPDEEGFDRVRSFEYADGRFRCRLGLWMDELQRPGVLDGFCGALRPAWQAYPGSDQ
jgi:hypothetical protein